MRSVDAPLALLAFGLAACQVDGRIYQSPDGAGDDDADAAIDVDADVATLDGPSFSLQYLPAAEAYPGTASWTITANTTLGTTSITATPAMPDGVTFTAAVQLEAGAPEVAVLRVDSFTVAAGVTVNTGGNRPLVIIAGGDVEIVGIIEAGSRNGYRGPGGEMRGSGTGAGTSGGVSAACDTGGGGAGHAGGGARGGTCGVVGGAGGSPYGEAPPMALRGGSGGGDGSTRAGSPCFSPWGGAGGGAIYVVSRTRISITGGINAGGGGGQGGLGTNVGTCAGDGTSGAGGGSGGQIALQAPMVVADGAGVALAANGGGGGGGGAYFGGGYGGSGGLSTTAAPGGAVSEPGTGAGVGGVGGALGNAPSTPASASTGAGGGGGAVGRITVWHGGTIQPLVTSPAATYVQM